MLSNAAVAFFKVLFDVTIIATELYNEGICDSDRIRNVSDNYCINSNTSMMIIGAYKWVCHVKYPIT